ncbi:hypothetical protein SORBI_3003G311250 [Sorghum bicolor]|uniref:Uncharacterized protein n=1 Tax=Sorghum bicolor TaxID=4558 RepID=A0A1W0VZT4_SORBI|nr:hypothetical protein SORBI_3003G311250 [Sorghum bicolor]
MLNPSSFMLELCPLYRSQWLKVSQYHAYHRTIHLRLLASCLTGVES